MLLGGHVKAVFTLITIIFVICVSYTITSFKEMPLYLFELRGNMDHDEITSNYERYREEAENEQIPIDGQNYGALDTKSDFGVSNQP